MRVIRRADTPFNCTRDNGSTSSGDRNYKTMLLAIYRICYMIQASPLRLAMPYLMRCRSVWVLYGSRRPRRGQH